MYSKTFLKKKKIKIKINRFTLIVFDPRLETLFAGCSRWTIDKCSDGIASLCAGRISNSRGFYGTTNTRSLHPDYNWHTAKNKIKKNKHHFITIDLFMLQG